MSAADDDDPGSDESGSDSDDGPDDPAGDHFDHDYGDESYLGADEMVKEIQEMADGMREWAVAHGLDPDPPSGGRSDKHAPTLDLGDLFPPLPRDEQWRLEGTQYIDMAFLAMQHGGHVTSTTGGKHNPGSMHGKGRANDWRTKGYHALQVSQLMIEARKAGYSVRDERKRPPDQKIWGGPHIHISAPERNSFDRAFDRAFRDFLTGRSADRREGQRDSGMTDTLHEPDDPPNIRLRMP